MDQVGGSYPSDLTEHQWECIKGLIPDARSGGRPRTTCVRNILNAVFYVNRTGCPWRHLPRDFPPWKTVYDYFNKWQQMYLWKKINDILVKQVRLACDKKEFPSCLIIDSQTAKAHYGGHRGYDGYKKMRGRKRQILVDTLGLIHGVHIHAADLSDTKEGRRVITEFEPKRKVELLLADKGYRGTFADMVFLKFGLWTSIIGSKESGNLKPKRWIVERTFAWFNFFRRLSRDYERNAKNSEAMIYVSMIQLMLRRSFPERLPSTL